MSRSERYKTQLQHSKFVEAKKNLSNVTHFLADLKREEEKKSHDDPVVLLLDQAIQSNSRQLTRLNILQENIVKHKKIPLSIIPTPSSSSPVEPDIPPSSSSSTIEEDFPLESTPSTSEPSPLDPSFVNVFYEIIETAELLRKYSIFFEKVVSYFQEELQINLIRRTIDKIPEESFRFFILFIFDQDVDYVKLLIPYVELQDRIHFVHLSILPHYDVGFPKGLKKSIDDPLRWFTIRYTRRRADEPLSDENKKHLKNLVGQFRLVPQRIK